MTTWFVYTAQFYSPSKLVKVGVSSNPDCRAKGACTELYISGRCTAKVKVGDRLRGYAVESLTHALLDEYRAFGEWFLVTKEQAVTAIEFAKKLILSTYLDAKDVYEAINIDRKKVLENSPEQACYLKTEARAYKSNKRPVDYYDRIKIISDAQIEWLWGENTVANQKKKGKGK